MCVVDAAGKIVKEAKVATDPQVLVTFFKGLGFPVTRIELDGSNKTGMKSSMPALHVSTERRLRSRLEERGVISMADLNDVDIKLLDDALKSLPA